MMAESPMRGNTKRGRWLWPLALALWPLNAQADEPTLFSGTWVSVLGMDTQADAPGEDLLVLRNRLDLDLRHPISDTMRVKIAARLWQRTSAARTDSDGWKLDVNGHFPDFGLRYDQLAELREAYVQWDLGPGRLTVGRDIVQWGALEMQSPWRIWNPVDYSQGILGALNPDDTPILADWMVRWSQPLAGGRFEGIFQPFFTEHRFSPFATDTAVVRPDVGPPLPQGMFQMLRHIDLRLDRQLGDALTTALNPPPATPLAGSMGARWLVNTGNWELGVAAIFNWDRMPILHFDPNVATMLGKMAAVGFDTAKQVALLGDPEYQAAQAAVTASGKGPLDLVSADWQRRLTLGGQWSVEVAEGWIVRGDLAYAPKVGSALGRVVFTDKFEPLVTSMLLTGAGVEWTHGDTLAAVVEATWNFAMDVPQAQPLFLMARHQVVVTGGGQWKFGENQAWALQMGGMYGISLGDWAALPRLSWKFADGWQAGLSAAFTGGPLLSPGGLYKTDDQVLVDIRLVF